MSSFFTSDRPSRAAKAKTGMYANISSAYHLGRALSAVFGGFSAIVVIFLYKLPGGLFIVPAAFVVAWDSYRQISEPRRSPVLVLLADSLVLLAAIVLLRPPTVLLIGPIAVLITAAMLLLPWHQTLAVLFTAIVVAVGSSSFQPPFLLDLPDELVALLTPMMAAAYLPSFIVLLRGVSQVLADRQSLNDELARRLRYEQGIASCSLALLASSSGASLTSALESLLEATDVDAIVVARNMLDADGELSRELISSVNRSDNAPYVAANREFRWSEAPTIRDHLRDGKTFFYTPGSVSGAEAELFDESGIKSDLVIPIGVNGEWAGYISFTDCSGTAEWGSYDLELLPSVARMIGAHWTRLENAGRLEAMIDYKDEFVASVSHELRTPLTAVVGFAEELRDGFEQMQPEETRELIDLISEQSLEVAHIVEDLLVVARLGGDSLTLVPEEICGLTEADHVVRSLGMTDHVAYTGSDHAYAIADSGRYRQIFRNLLTNARRYGGDQIVVHAAYDGAETVIAVRDNGVGVPTDRWEQIFEPYERTRQPGSNPASVGLGLTVSRQLARLMSGDLDYRYRDGWSEFQLRVPISQRSTDGRRPVSTPSQSRVDAGIRVTDRAGHGRVDAAVEYHSDGRE